MVLFAYYVKRPPFALILQELYCHPLRCRLGLAGAEVHPDAGLADGSDHPGGGLCPALFRQLADDSRHLLGADRMHVVLVDIRENVLQAIQVFVTNSRRDADVYAL